MPDFTTPVVDHGDLQLPLDVIKRLALSDTGFIFDPVTGHSYTTNATGLAIVRHARLDQNAIRIAEKLTAEFDIGLSECEREVVEFAAALRTLGG